MTNLKARALRQLRTDLRFPCECIQICRPFSSLSYVEVFSRETHRSQIETNQTSSRTLHGLVRLQCWNAFLLIWDRHTPLKFNMEANNFRAEEGNWPLDLIKFGGSMRSLGFAGYPGPLRTLARAWQWPYRRTSCLRFAGVVAPGMPGNSAEVKRWRLAMGGSFMSRSSILPFSSIIFYLTWERTPEVGTMQIIQRLPFGSRSHWKIRSRICLAPSDNHRMQFKTIQYNAIT